MKLHPACPRRWRANGARGKVDGETGGLRYFFHFKPGERERERGWFKLFDGRGRSTRRSSVGMGWGGGWAPLTSVEGETRGARRRRTAWVAPLGERLTTARPRKRGPCILMLRLRLAMSGTWRCGRGWLGGWKRVDQCSRGSQVKWDVNLCGVGHVWYCMVEAAQRQADNDNLSTAWLVASS